MANYYSIFTKYDHGIYERGDSNYYAVDIKNVDANALVDPSTVSITITDPCGATVVATTNMTKSATGVYYHTYAIGSAAVFGEYIITVKASSVTYGDTLYKDKFFILPWNAVQDVRELSGIGQNNSISDSAMAHVIWEAYQEALDRVYDRHYREIPNPNPDTGVRWDGTNTTFELPHAPLADHNGDGTVTGYGDGSCATDVEMLWRDEDGNCHVGYVDILDTNCGKVKLTQDGTTAIPNTACWVKVTYYSQWRSYNERLFRKAVSYLAAQECILRFHELDKATLADIMSNKTVILANPNRMEEKYKKIMRKISKPLIGSGMKPGSSFK